MGATASLSASAISIQPGGTATVEVLVRNNGSVVDELTLRILGEAVAWAVVEPASLSLFPQTEGTARVTFSPPSSSFPRAGPQAFGVMVSSREDPEGSVVEEGTVDIAPFTDTLVELIPHAGRGWRSAHYRLAVDNRGNVPVSYQLTGLDPNGSLNLYIRPAGVDVLAGTTTFARVTTTATHWLWRGQPLTLPFVVQAGSTDESEPPIRSEGVMLHVAILPRWILKALVLAAAVVLAAVGVWYGLLRPNIRSQARAVAQKQSTKAVAQAHKALVASQQAKQAAGSASKSAGVAAQAATKATGKKFVAPATSTTLPGPETTSTGGRVVITAPPGMTVDQVLAGIPPKKPFQLTDVVFENPNGDSGTVSVMRGSAVVLFENLANFRDLDYHFVSPITFPAGTPVTFSATCTNPAAAKVPCQPAVYLGGYLG
ncbi:MAG: hypothetical protein ACRDY2_11955 [Acidimicrobiales bacterium]